MHEARACTSDQMQMISSPHDDLIRTHVQGAGALPKLAVVVPKGHCETARPDFLEMIWKEARAPNQVRGDRVARKQQRLGAVVDDGPQPMCAKSVSAPTSIAPPMVVLRVHCEKSFCA